MDQAAIGLLICPHCGGALRQNGGSLICSRGHTANIARQGYVSLLGRDSGTHTADTATMVSARERFLAGGHFRPLSDALAEAAGNLAGQLPDGAVIDVGCGTGQHMSAVLERLPDRVGIGIDNSKYAARRAARAHPRASALVADIWDQVPVASSAAALMLNVFSPRNGEEMERILAPGGRLVVVTPRPGHLAELAGPFGLISVDPHKEERLERSLGPLAERATVRELTWPMKLTRDEVRDLVEMGPNAGRMDPAGLAAALDGLEDETSVTAEVTITAAEKG